MHAVRRKRRPPRSRREADLMCNYGFRSGISLGERRSPAVAARTPNCRGRRLSRKTPVTRSDMPAGPSAGAVLVGNSVRPLAVHGAALLSIASPAGGPPMREP